MADPTEVLSGFGSSIGHAHTICDGAALNIDNSRSTHLRHEHRQCSHKFSVSVHVHARVIKGRPCVIVAH